MILDICILYYLLLTFLFYKDFLFVKKAGFSLLFAFVHSLCSLFDVVILVFIMLWALPSRHSPVSV